MIKKSTLYQQKYFKNNPWAKKYRSSYVNARRKNLEHRITTAELKELWFRDKAYELENPSIDRIDSTKGYFKENCRFIELKENQARNNRGRKTTEKQREHSVRWMSKLRRSSRKLKPNQVRKVRLLIAQGEKNLKKIADLFKCDRATIAHIKRNETYKDIK